MPETPTYRLPYPALPDSPDVPRDMRALAEGVDTALAEQKTELTNTITGQPREFVVDGVWAAANDASITIPAGISAPDTLLWTVTIPDPGYLYRVRVYAVCSFSYSSDGAYARVVLRGTGGLNTGPEYVDMDAGPHLSGWVPTTWPGIVTPVLSGASTLYLGARASSQTTAHVADRRGHCSVDVKPV